MDHVTVTREEMQLAGIETRASNAEAHKLGEHWGRFFGDERLRGVDKLDDDVIAVYCEYEGDHTQPYPFFLGYRVAAGAEVAEGLVQRQVPGGSFAKVVSLGEQPAALIESWQTIWGAPLARRDDADYEIHSASDRSRVEIYVGI